jgi:lipopolysaccharide transport system ATP-binding protein
VSDIAIRVDKLGKQYRIGGKQEHYKTLRDSLANAASRPFRIARSLFRGKPDHDGRHETIWALKDVSFEVKCGEVVGIIGRNGAGKSTLLKILARITEPTVGFAEIHGRVGSLLEVGTGFHPELTGRENIYLNGAILGMRRAEIELKFDEIVAFAELDQFIDTVVKYYSSGMYMRLAFAVAAHLEPEILLVDEVLAVGDAAFQKKCLGKMGEVARQGRTVLFVSHDMTNISLLCRSAILLESGGARMSGPAARIVSAYLNQKLDARPMVRWEPDEAPGNDVVRILSLSVFNEDGGSQGLFTTADPVQFVIEFAVGSGDCRLNPVFVVRNSLGLILFSTANYEDPRWGARRYATGRYRAQCVAPSHLLNEGRYWVDAMLVRETRAVEAECKNSLSFEVYDDGATRGGYVGDWLGAVRPRCQWSTLELDVPFCEEKVR